MQTFDDTSACIARTPWYDLLFRPLRAGPATLSAALTGAERFAMKVLTDLSLRAPHACPLAGGWPMSRSVLIIEDEGDFADVMAMNLRRASLDVRVARTGEAGLREARHRRPDIVLLDLMLPDLPGTEVCRRLKQDPFTREVPVIMVTARGEDVDRIVGFELGADDYVVKPVVMRELVLRVQAVLRRAHQATTEEGTLSLEVGPIRIDGPAHRVFVNGREVSLTALEFRLLATLASAVDRVMSRETLLDRVWGIQADIETRTVDTMMKRLRDKMGSAGNLLETVRGVGYRLRGPEPSKTAG